MRPASGHALEKKCGHFSQPAWRLGAAAWEPSHSPCRLLLGTAVAHPAHCAAGEGRPVTCLPLRFILLGVTTRHILQRLRHKCHARTHTPQRPEAQCARHAGPRGLHRTALQVQQSQELSEQLALLRPSVIRARPDARLVADGQPEGEETTKAELAYARRGAAAGVVGAHVAQVGRDACLALNGSSYTDGKREPPDTFGRSSWRRKGGSFRHEGGPFWLEVTHE